MEEAPSAARGHRGSEMSLPAAGCGQGCLWVWVGLGICACVCFSNEK